MKLKKSLLGLLFLFVLGAVLAGCSAPLETELSVDRRFSGKRVMSCFFTQRQLGATGHTLTELLEQSCPDELSWFVAPAEGGERCELTLTFATKQEYVKKVTALLNAGTHRDPDYTRTPFVLYSTPDTILTSGCRLREDFTSADLLEWLLDAFDDACGRPSGIVFEFTRNEVITDGGQPVPVSKLIDLNSLSAEAVSRIEIETTQAAQSDRFSRVVRIVFPQHTVDSLGTALTDFLRDSLSEDARSAWKQEDGSSIYTVVFAESELSELEEDTRSLFHSDQSSLKAAQVAEHCSPTVDERTVEESIDLSGFFSAGSTTEVRYTFTANEHTQLIAGSVYGTGAWVNSDKITDHRVFTFEGKEDLARFRLTLSETHLIDSVDIAMRHNADGTYAREVAFVFSDKSHNGAEYCERFFKEIRPSEAGVTVEERSRSTVCRVAMNGDAAKLSELCAKLFGSKNSLTIAETDSTFSLKNYLLFQDEIAMADLLGETNKPTPLHYTFTLDEAEAARVRSLEYTEYNNRRKADDVEDSGSFSFSVPCADTSVSYDGSSYNVGGVIVLVLFTLLLCAVLVALFLLLLRTGRDPWFNNPANCALAEQQAREHRRMVFRRREEKRNLP